MLLHADNIQPTHVSVIGSMHTGVNVCIVLQSRELGFEISNTGMLLLCHRAGPRGDLVDIPIVVGCVVEHCTLESHNELSHTPALLLTAAGGVWLQHVTHSR